MNQLVTSMTTALDEMEWDLRKCQASNEDCTHQLQELKSGTAMWISQLDWLYQAVTHDPDMVIEFGILFKHLQTCTHTQKALNICIPAGFHQPSPIQLCFFVFLFFLSVLSFLVSVISFLLPNSEQVTTGRSNIKDDQHVSRCKFRQEKRGGICRFENDSIKLWIIQWGSGFYRR